MGMPLLIFFFDYCNTLHGAALEASAGIECTHPWLVNGVGNLAHVTSAAQSALVSSVFISAIQGNGCHL